MRVFPMSSGYNVFEPEDLELAQSVLDEIWVALPSSTRDDPQAIVLRERIARHILAAMSKDHAGRAELKASATRMHTSEQS
jgi:hypothetical protein